MKQTFYLIVIHDRFCIVPITSLAFKFIYAIVFCGAMLIAKICTLVIIQQ